MSKYCVSRPEPEWEKVSYTDGNDDAFTVRLNSNGNHFNFKISDGIPIHVNMDDMQDLIDSLQAFYNQEKGS